MSKDHSKKEIVQVKNSIDAAMQKYIESRYEKIPEFVSQYFSIRGAFRINKKALGADLVKGPFNIFWALPYTGLRAGSSLLRKMKAKRIPEFIGKLPPGFETRVQKEIRWLIYTELLELPYILDNRRSTKDKLFEEILNHPDVATLFVEELARIRNKSQDPKFRKVLEENLLEYSASRTAAADLAGSIIALSVGVTMFHKMTPGAMATGTAMAGAIAQNVAVNNFFLGSTLGSFYYNLFPASASIGLTIASIGTIMTALALFTSFAGIITDPMQAKLGIHQRRLKRFIGCLEKELSGEGESRFEIRDRYVARVFDFLDMMKTAAATVV
ncbi:hypothetical protein GF337_19870 [candidate division KSB1 bacterium]|nr:hypothetical protein [candidate division KSB1 bacterium]